MCLMRHMYTITYVPGKSIITAELSRAPQERPQTETEELFMDEVMAQATLVGSALPATERRLAEVRARQLVSTGYALLCGGLAQPAIGADTVLPSAEQFDDPQRVTPQGGEAHNPTMHATGNDGQAT